MIHDSQIFEEKTTDLIRQNIKIGKIKSMSISNCNTEIQKHAKLMTGCFGWKESFQWKD